ncbi:biotin-dependent carboxyltransferase family protein [Thalassotalea aquiviva]|uniref:5-oxoprolinase subunit C family protein n=1 Tax=Thalassotalea aquiviva TaxID=3242415 RepID=UPI003529D680
MSQLGTLEVTSSGPYSILVDSGRRGFHHLGLTRGGPIDLSAFTLANRLCQNDIDATVIEVTLGGLQAKVHAPCVIALTGACNNILINGQAKPLWCTHQLEAGDNIELTMASSGLRSYLAIAGGFQLAKMFNSTSTVCREHVGGLSGDKLKVGDHISFLPSHFYATSSTKSATTIKRRPQQLALNAQQRIEQRYQQTKINLRLIPGYQYQDFDRVQRALFFNSEFEVSKDFDRMGYRLLGQRITTDKVLTESQALCLGAVQIPSNGEPIVMLHDHQTIGGYPKIGTVIEPDLALLGQSRAGVKVQFTAIDVAQAHGIRLLQRDKLCRLQLSP